MIKKNDKKFQNIKSYIAEGVEVHGQVLANGSMRIDGMVDGELEVKGDLLIGQTGIIKGGVKVENVMLSGRIEGTLAASGKVEINSTGQMIGDVMCNVFMIEEGGIMEGNSKMNYKKATVEPEKNNSKKSSKES